MFFFNRVITELGRKVSELWFVCGSHHNTRRNFRELKFL